MKNISLRLKMFIFSFIIVIFSVATSGAIMIHNLAGALEKEFGARAIAIARTVSQLTDVQNNVGKPAGFTVIQPIAERIRLTTDVDYIVIIDMNRIRYSTLLKNDLAQFLKEEMKSKHFLSMSIYQRHGVF